MGAQAAVRHCYISVILLIHSTFGKGVCKGNTKVVITPKAEIAYKPLAMRGEMAPDQ